MYKIKQKTGKNFHILKHKQPKSAVRRNLTYLLWWNVESDRPQVDFCVRINAGQNKKYSCKQAMLKIRNIGNLEIQTAMQCHDRLTSYRWNLANPDQLRTGYWCNQNINFTRTLTKLYEKFRVLQESQKHLARISQLYLKNFTWGSRKKFHEQSAFSDAQ